VCTKQVEVTARTQNQSQAADEDVEMTEKSSEEDPVTAMRWSKFSTLSPLAEKLVENVVCVYVCVFNNNAIGHYI